MKNNLLLSCLFCLSLHASLCADTAEIDLAGEWSLSGCGRTLAAKIPGGVHDALLEAGIIDDIYWGANETNQLWAARSDWKFWRRFTVPEDFLAKKDAILRLEDCDAFCTVRINGHVAGETTDRFQRYDFDVKPYLKAGENTIEGFFRSPVAVADERRRRIGRPYPISNPIWAKNQALVRKNACHAGWDWGPEVESIGFCGTVKLIASDRPRIDYIHTLQDFNGDLSHCTLRVIADLSDGSSVTNRLELENPPLWWPNGAGERKFFMLETDIAGEHVKKRIGLRKLEVLNERTKRADGKEELSLAFRVNNRRLFMKGANWIPCDALERRQTPEKYRDLLESAAEANMNMIRVWGGGQYEKDVFYDICDELGLLVWHDMMCSCAVYPAEEWFLDEIRRELSHQLRRLKDHASIAMWCGDNECLGAINWFDETKENKDFYREEWVKRSKMQAEAVAKHDPARTYWPSSPCCGPGDFGDGWKDDSKGDMHQWDVWHDNKPFEKYREYRPRFCSEFGFQSFPSPEVAKTFSDGPGDDFEWHQKNIGGNKRIRETFLRYFGQAKDFESELLLSQFQQGLAIKTAVEAWRSGMPRTMGTLYWQLNDIWPVASWSSLEYGGKWKPLHYMARRFYAPLAVVLKPDGSIVAVNDSPDRLTGELTVEYWAYDGVRPAFSERTRVTIEPDGVTAIGRAEKRGNLFAVLTLHAGGGVARNDSAVYRQTAMAEPCIVAMMNGGEVTLSTDRPAFFVWLNAEGVKGEFSDNAFTLLPGRPVTVEFGGDAEAMEKSLRIASLADTLARPEQSGPRPGAAANP
ncbi:MAG: glycoside hydrolase family 2 protein [Kiritimatiellae bacterium]|nr:glycoside hydrolase family 2 protein [Kiritimatiellia bacterium]